MFKRILFCGLCAVAAFAFSAPVSAQATLVGQFAPVLPLEPGEGVIGLTTANSQLSLISMERLFTSPFLPVPGNFVDSGIAWTLSRMNLSQTSQVTNNPANPNEIWLTGVGGRGVFVLYKAQIDTSILPAIVNSAQVPLPVTNPPQSLASDGSAAYIVSNNTDVLKIDGTTGATLFDLGPSNFIASPRQVAFGPDGLLYVLDSNSTTGRIVSFDVNGNFVAQFPLSQPSEFQDFGPMTISSTGQLYSQSTEVSTGTLGIDSYDTHSGAFLGRVSGYGTFSADQNINPGGHPVIFSNSGYLYYATGTGQYVWLLATGIFGTPGNPNCHGQTIVGLTHQYDSIAKAAAELGFPNVAALQSYVTSLCGN